MPATRKSDRAPAQVRISPAQYAGFIRQIELADIWLHAATIHNAHGSEQPDRAEVKIESSARWEARPRGFRAFHRWEVHVTSASTPSAEIEVEFGLDFISETPMNEPLFEIFCEHNLPVNTWPYLREFVSTSTGRMGWSSLTLPALKRGTERVEKPEAETVGEAAGIDGRAAITRRRRTKVGA